MNRRGTTFDRTIRLRGSDVAHLADVTYRQLDYWARAGLFGDDLIGPGSGGRREWKPQHAALAQGLGQLARLNATLDTLGLLADRAELVVPIPFDRHASSFLYVIPDIGVDEYPPASWIRAMYVIVRAPMFSAFSAASELIDARLADVC